MRTVTFQVGDLILLNTEHYNLQLPSLKLSPQWIGPLKIKQIWGPNTILIEVPPRLRHIEPIQNVEHVKPYISRPPEIGPSTIPPIPDLVDGDEEFEVDFSPTVPTTNGQSTWFVLSDMDWKMIFGYRKKICKMHTFSRTIMTNNMTTEMIVDQYHDSRLHTS